MPTLSADDSALPLRVSLHNGTGSIRLDVSSDTAVQMPSGTHRVWSASGNVAINFGNLPVHLGSRLGLSPTSTKSRQIDFEDFTLIGQQATKIRSGYAGLSWRGINVVNGRGISGGFGYANGTISGNNVAYTSSGHSAAISADTSFTLHEMVLTLGWPVEGGEVAVFQYYNMRGDLIREDRIPVLSRVSTRYMPMQNGISTVEITTEKAWQLVIDDINYQLEN